MSNRQFTLEKLHCLYCKTTLLITFTNINLTRHIQDLRECVSTEKYLKCKKALIRKRSLKIKILKRLKIYLITFAVTLCF